MYRTKKAFTLIELLVVISVIALLLSVLMPALSKVKSQARRLVCLTRVRQINLALQMYAQQNSNHIVPGRFHNGGDWLSVNTWYSNLTPYLDTSKTPADKVYLMADSDAAQYNQVWNDLVCPAERKPVIVPYQGVAIRTYGINMAISFFPNTRYQDGFGLQDWNTGATRKITEMKSPSSVLAFCDTRDLEYVGLGTHLMLESRGYNVDDYIPVRHPGGYNVAFADGHCSVVEETVIKVDVAAEDRIWRVR